METLLLRRAGDVLHVTLNRPARRNALTAAMVEELGAAFAQAGDARVIVLRGAGGNFCAGGDAGDMLQRAGAGATALGNRRFGDLLGTINEAPRLVVAAVEGAAMGGGFGLVCVSDVALAASDARFGMPETTLGLVPAQISPYVCQRLGLTQARALALTGTRIDAAEALRIGLVHRVGDVEALVEETLQRALACAPGAVKATKRLLFRIAGEEFSAALDDAAQVFAEAMQGEGVEGLAAFREKRRPPWRPS